MSANFAASRIIGKLRAVSLSRFLTRNKDLIEAASLLATALIALASAVLFYTTSKENIEFQSEVTANETWVSYRELGLEHKDLNLGKINLKTMSLEDASEYRLLVERLLMAADLVTYSLAHDAQWEGAFAIEFQKHKEFLTSRFFLAEQNGIMSEFCTYRHAVHDWLERAFKADEIARKKISAAHAICKKTLDSQGYTE